MANICGFLRLGCSTIWAAFGSRFTVPKKALADLANRWALLTRGGPFRDCACEPSGGAPVRRLLIALWAMDAPFRILTVDNEPSVTLSLKFLFAGPRYEVLCVADGHAALAKLEATPDPYDLIIVDQKMPSL